MEKRFEYYAHLAALMFLVLGCYLVLEPFLSATLLAAVVCISTWPLYVWLLGKLRGRQNIAALCMTLVLALVVILPMALLAYNLSDNVTDLINAIKQIIKDGPLEPPVWLNGVPIVGESAAQYWHLVATNHSELTALVERLLEPTQNFLLAGGIMLGQGVMEMSLAALFCFFLYRDGADIVRFLQVAMDRVIGSRGSEVLNIINNTVRGVMYGFLGTALAQGFVATLGFAIAGVPAALLLGVITFLLSFLPVGPPLIWGGAAAWLFYQGTVGWGIFMLLWGVLLISSVDNVLKPMLISRSSNLPFILGLIGVFGGVAAFGFVGIFIGPTLLAVTFNLIQQWEIRESSSDDSAK